MSTKIAFASDGSFTLEQTVRVHVQTDAGIKKWGLLVLPFQSATQIVDIDYVRVRKADGSAITTPDDNVQDLDSEITRSAPFYSDLREKHVAVKGLGSGDILEYEAHWHTTKPLIPGQFWFQYNFQREGIVLNERLEIKTPAERTVKVKGPQATQTIRNDPGTRVYSWTGSRLQNSNDPEAEQEKATKTALGRVPPSDVQISSFQNWEEVGRWYWNLQRDRIEPTPAIRAKAEELTRGLTNDTDKVNALYRFVATQYRYIGVAFGIGRYQPHAAEDVLSNKYGDCKDKQTLLAALLQAVGVTLNPALINSRSALDPDVPSPAQFDHVIGYLPQSKELLWLDTTPEVTPPGYLLQQLRDKQALVMLGDKSIQLLTTPADPPNPSSQSFKIDGKLSNDGSLEAKVEIVVQGESEIPVRAAFRQIPQPQWKDLVQQISYGLGYSGTVSDVSASVPEAIGEPFHFSYAYNRKDYPDWSNRQFTVPGHPFFVPPVKDDAKYPIWLGPPLATVSDSRVELPPGYTPQAPPNVDLKYDFAEYHATYSYDKGALAARRQLLIKMHEVPVAELGDYRNFIKDMRNDVDRYVQTSSASASAPSSQMGAMPSVVKDLWSLPNSDSDEATKLETEARDQAQKGDTQGAVSSLYRSVSADPKFTRAWVLLGTLLFKQNQIDAGMDAFHKAMAADPNRSAIPKVLGYGLMGSGRFEDAIPVWQDYIKAHPEDADGPANLGNCLLGLKRYAEAAASYQAALKVKEDQPNMQAGLGQAYLLAGERDKAVAAFQKLAESDGGGVYFNDVAYKMANADLELPLALEYAKKAVRKTEEDSLLIALESLTLGDLQQAFKLSAYWDTLGWVDERMSSLDAAETYLRASWALTQDGVVAGHLCHLYKRTHKISTAIDMCRMAISRMSMSKQATSDDYQTELAAARENLAHLTGTTNAKTTVDGSDLVIRERTFKLSRFLPGTESAEFFLLFESDGRSKTFKLADEKFISGSDKMKLQEKQLENIQFNFPAPNDAPAHFVRRGILGCYQYSGCSFVLLDPATVHTLQ